MLSLALLSLLSRSSLKTWTGSSTCSPVCSAFCSSRSGLPLTTQLAATPWSQSLWPWSWSMLSVPAALACNGDWPSLSEGLGAARVRHQQQAGANPFQCKSISVQIHFIANLLQWKSISVQITFYKTISVQIYFTGQSQECWGLSLIQKSSSELKQMKFVFVWNKDKPHPMFTFHFISYFIADICISCEIIYGLCLRILFVLLFIFILTQLWYIWLQKTPMSAQIICLPNQTKKMHFLTSARAYLTMQAWLTSKGVSHSPGFSSRRRSLMHLHGRANRVNSPLLKQKCLGVKIYTTFW